MDYNNNVIGHYSKSRGQARIYKSKPVSLESGLVTRVLETVYDKNVTYRTYLKNLKRIIKENETA